MMMEPILLQTATAQSRICFFDSLGHAFSEWQNRGQQSRRCIAIVDEKVDVLYGHLFSFEKIVVTATESEKTMPTVEKIVAELLEMEADRNVVLLGIGGGIVTDICGFVAAIYKRGVACAFFPTTLLAMVDASVGGKNGVNVNGFKNMVGTVRQPEAVYICPDFLQSFDKQEFNKSLPELLKTRLIAQQPIEEMFSFFKILDVSILQQSEEKSTLLSFIRDAVAVKCSIVSQDETDQGSRRILNLGHTFAHAIEHCTENRLTHGEAVGIGLVLAARNSGQEGLADKITHILTAWGLPSRVPSDCAIENLQAAVRQDKKNAEEIVNLVVFDIDGKSVIKRKRVSDLKWD